MKASCLLLESQSVNNYDEYRPLAFWVFKKQEEEKRDSHKVKLNDIRIVVGDILYIFIIHGFYSMI